MNWFRNLFTPTGTFPIQQREMQPTAHGVPATTDQKAASNQPKVTGGSYQERIVYVNHPWMALSVSPVYRAVKLIMDTHGLMPVQYRSR